MFVVLVVLLTMLWPGIAIIKAQCRAPLTLMLTGILVLIRVGCIHGFAMHHCPPLPGQNYWEARIGETLYKGPFNGKQTLVPYSSHERYVRLKVNCVA